MLPLLLPLLALALVLPTLSSPIQQTPLVAHSPTPLRVPVVLGVMSRCPDAVFCESVWDKVLDRVGELVDVEMLYIGSLNSTLKYGVDCMHGVEECTGNIQQLCAYEAWVPASSTSLTAPEAWGQWWDFIQCQNYGPREEIGLEETARRCAKSVGHDWEAEGLASCVASKHGSKLLQDSVQTSKDLGITKSCTVVINGRQVCIHDSTWKECEGGHEVGDFVRQVKEEWEGLNNGEGAEEEGELGVRERRMGRWGVFCR